MSPNRSLALETRAMEESRTSSFTSPTTTADEGDELLGWKTQLRSPCMMQGGWSVSHLHDKPFVGPFGTQLLNIFDLVWCSGDVGHISNAAGESLKQGPRNLFWRLVGFLTLHASRRERWEVRRSGQMVAECLVCNLEATAPVACTHAAWGAEPTHLQWPWGLPLKDQPLLLRAVLAIPLGFMQGVIILLAWDQYLERKNHESGGQDWNYPPEEPFMRTSWSMEQHFLSTMAIIVFLSCGFGIVELDFCCSKTVSKRMRTWYEFLHLYFRVSEFVVRTLLHVAFLVLTRWLVSWWWCPFVIGNFFFQFMVVLIHGGDESKLTVRLLCCYPCAWVNVFFFVDSPYKRRAARKISFWFEARFFWELLLLPLLAYLALWSVDRVDDLEKIITVHPWMFQILIFNVLSYIILRIYMNYSICRQMNLTDIYTPSEEGDKDSLTALETFWADPAALKRIQNRMFPETFGTNFATVRELTRAASADIDLNRPDVDGNTPLMLAARQGHAKVCELLMHRGAFVSIPQQGGKGMRNWTSMATCRSWTALHMAAWHNHAKVIKVFVINGACSEDNMSAVVRAVSNVPFSRWPAKEFQVTRPETSNGIGSSLKSVEWGLTHISGETKSFPVGWLERDTGPLCATSGLMVQESQYLDTHGDTPLHIAARAGALEAAKVLIAHWPQWLVTLNAQNKRPQELAVLKGLQQMLAPGSSWFGANMEDWAVAGQWKSVFRRGVVSWFFSAASEHVWLSVPLHISRKRVQLRAPGICSYVAASCGGALGRMCLITGQDQEEQEEDWGKGLMVRIPGAVVKAMIGEGAYGQVFRAKHRRRDVLYAVKVFKTPRDRPASPEVARECDVGTLIHQTPHPCIVRLYMVTFDEDSGHYTLVMEFCPSNLFQRVHSATLQNMAKGLPYKPPPQTLDWLGQVFLGLEHMHKRLNILFRDLKPGNVILDSAQCAKLADFGSGRVGPSAGTFSFGHPAGTVGYCAPEVLGGMPHDERADLYSLGVLTWLLFTGGMPGSSQPPVQPRAEVHQHLYDWLLLRKCLEDSGQRQTLRITALQASDNFPPFQGVSASDLAQQAAEARDCGSVAAVTHRDLSAGTRRPDERHQ
eukprot:s379_g8.t1